ncbi:unnamed protein product [Gadus morhua 'NCC']
MRGEVVFPQRPQSIWRRADHTLSLRCCENVHVGYVVRPGSGCGAGGLVELLACRGVQPACRINVCILILHMWLHGHPRGYVAVAAEISGSEGFLGKPAPPPTPILIGVSEMGPLRIRCLTVGGAILCERRVRIQVSEMGPLRIRCMTVELSEAELILWAAPKRMRQLTRVWRIEGGSA